MPPSQDPAMLELDFWLSEIFYNCQRASHKVKTCDHPPGGLQELFNNENVK